MKIGELVSQVVFHKPEAMKLNNASTNIWLVASRHHVYFQDKKSVPSTHIREQRPAIICEQAGIYIEGDLIPSTPRYILIQDISAG